MSSRSERWRRRWCALCVVVLACADIAQALSRQAIEHLGRFSLHLGGTTTRLFRYVIVLAAVTLFSIVRGLLHGKRNAFLIGLAACVVSMVGHHIVRSDIIGITAAFAVIVVLFANRRLFVARHDPFMARQALYWLGAGLVGSYAYGVLGLYLLDAQFRRSTTLRQSFGEATRLLFLLPVSTIEPATRHGHWFVDSVRVLVLFVIVVGIGGLLRPVALHGRFERDLSDVASILERSGTSPLAYFHLLPDKHHLFSTDRQAFIGYKVVGSVAISLGGPIGEPASRREVTREFLRLCELNGWRPAFHQVAPPDVAELAAFGLRAIKIGEEALIDVRTFSLTGSHFKSMRSKVGRMQREGWRVEQLPAPLDAATLRRLREISDAWLADGGHRERTFSVGQFSDEYLQSTTVLVARDPDGIIRGFTNLIPSYAGPSGNFDLMRRDPTARLPVMDFLFVAMIERFRGDGLETMTLGLAPFANIDGSTPADRALRLLYEHGGRAFNFVGLRNFKDKWRPVWEPRYLVYRFDTELAPVALGVSRAGELTSATSSRLEAATGRAGSIARAGVSVVRRLPLTSAIATIVVALQIATTIDRDAYVTLARTLRYNWADLAVHGQLYRIPASIFLQDGPGVRPGLFTMVPLLAASELILRSRRSLSVFFAGDLASSLPILIVLRIAAALGNAAAQRAITVRDGGISSATFALVSASLATTPNRRLRRIGSLVFVGYLVIDTIVQHQLFNAQHAAAAFIGLALAPRRNADDVPSDHAPGDDPSAGPLRNRRWLQRTTNAEPQS